MFSGLGSMADLNQQFAQFTSSLTNLDTMQDSTDSSSKQDALETTDVTHNSSSVQTKSDTTDAVNESLKQLLLEKDIHLETLNCELQSYKSNLIAEQQKSSDLFSHLKLLEENFKEKYFTLENSSKQIIDSLTVSLTELQCVCDEKTQQLEISMAATNTTIYPVADTADEEEALTNMKTVISNLEISLKEERSRIISLQSELRTSTKRFKKAEIALKRSEELVESERKVAIENIGKAVAEEKEMQSSERSKELELLYASMEKQKIAMNEEVTAMKHLLNDKESEVVKLLNSLEVQNNAHAIAVAQLNEQIKECMASNALLNDEKQKITALLQVKEEERYEISRQLQDNISNSVVDNQTITNELATLRGSLEQKELLIDDLNSKLSVLTEKLKDVMHRYADVKTKASADAALAKDRLTELTKLAQAKDSEILGCKMKAENTERASSDLRLKAAELAERYGESQREITRLHAIQHEQQQQLQSVQQSLTTVETEMHRCLEEKTEAVRQLSELESSKEVLVTQYEQEKVEVHEQYEKQRSMNEETIVQLQTELARAGSRLNEESNCAGELESYKKRAQLALKKANQASAVLTKENEQLHSTVEELTKKLRDMESKVANTVDSAVKAAITEKEACITKITALEKELSSCLNKLNEEANKHTAMLLQQDNHNSRNNNINRNNNNSNDNSDNSNNSVSPSSSTSYSYISRSDDGNNITPTATTTTTTAMPHTARTPREALPSGNGNNNDTGWVAVEWTGTSTPVNNDNNKTTASTGGATNNTSSNKIRNYIAGNHQQFPNNVSGSSGQQDGLLGKKLLSSNNMLLPSNSDEYGGDDDASVGTATGGDSNSISNVSSSNNLPQRMQSWAMAAASNNKAAAAATLMLNNNNSHNNGGSITSSNSLASFDMDTMSSDTAVKHNGVVMTAERNNYRQYSNDADDSNAASTTVATMDASMDMLTRSDTPSSSLLFVSELQAQLEILKRDLSKRGIDVEAANQELQYEKNENRLLKNRIEELMAFLDRSKKLHEGPDSAINMEYLKNCVFKFMCSCELTERKRLYPVIATILKFTNQEMKAVEKAFAVSEEGDNEFNNALNTIGSFATSMSSIGDLWGLSTTALLGSTTSSSTSSSSGGGDGSN